MREGRRSRGDARRRGLDCRRRMAGTVAGLEGRRRELGFRRRMAVIAASRRGWAAGRKDHGIRKMAAEVGRMNAGRMNAGRTRVDRKGIELGEVGCRGPGRDIRRSAEGEGPSRNLGI